MSRKSRRRKPMGEINVVPYIDVTLVLLIIFMITTPLLQTGVQVDLPEAESAVTEQKNDPPIVITINKVGEFFFQIQGEDEDPLSVTLVELKSRIASVTSNKPETQVLINGDKGVDYGTVVTVMAEIKNAGVPNVGLMTEPAKQ